MKKICAEVFTILACLLAATLTSQAGIFSSLHNFDSSNPGDGTFPNGVTLYNGQIFGSTDQGGANNGMVYVVGTNGLNFTPVHTFGNSPDGSSPNELLRVGDLFYGTTYVGGTNGNGTIFVVNTNGSTYAVLRSFTNIPDPQLSKSGLIISGATLYGVSLYGGSGGQGTVFKIDTNGANFAVLHSFTNTPDGANPIGRLVLSGATLYGITYAGGTNNNQGTVFKISTNGLGYSVICCFSNAPAASAPYAGLSLSGNTLYGVSTGGGTQDNGTVFQIGTNGTPFTIIHSFTNNEGFSLQGPLLLTNNLIYGTTLSGGADFSGTLFQLNLNGGNFTVLQNFTNTLTGANPKGQLVLDGNVVYGIAGIGGPGGGGTVYRFALSPAITSQPQPSSLTVTNGSPASFTVTATDGGPFSYQWYFNTTTLLGGQTGPTLNLGGTTPNSAGNYTVVVSDNGGSVTSSPATLTVLGLPTITTPPQSLTVTNGNPAAFTVTATTTSGTLTYQWYFNTNTLITGQTNSSYTIPVVATNNAGSYTVAVANNIGAVTSTPAVLTVSLNSKPVINSQPQNLIITNGDNATFTVGASGLNPLRYQWYSNSVNTAIGLPVPAQTTNVLTFSGIGRHYNGAYFSVVITNTLGKATSSPAFLTVVSEPLITTNPQSETVFVGNPATFTVTALNAMHYQWYSNTVSTAIGTLLAGQTGSTYSFTSITNANNRFYSVVVTNTFGKTTSSPAMLIVSSLPYITLQPVDAVLTGSSITFTSAAAGPGTLGYQWLYQTNLLVTGATNTILTLSNSSPQGAYSMKVTNSFGAATSSPAMFSIGSLPVPTITLQPLGATITNGSSITFTSSATGTGTLGYQWLYQTNFLIPGATGTSLTFPAANQPGTYSMKVTNSFGATTSTPALLTVVRRPIMLSSAFDPASGSYAFTYVNLAGSTNRLLATTNIALPGAWLAIATNIMATNGIWQLTDFNTARTNALRFYRFSSRDF